MSPKSCSCGSCDSAAAGLGAGPVGSRNQECPPSCLFNMKNPPRLNSKILAPYCAAQATISGNGTHAPRASTKRRRISPRWVRRESLEIGGPLIVCLVIEAHYGGILRKGNLSETLGQEKSFGQVCENALSKSFGQGLEWGFSAERTARALASANRCQFCVRRSRSP